MAFDYDFGKLDALKESPKSIPSLGDLPLNPSMLLEGLPSDPSKLGPMDPQTYESFVRMLYSPEMNYFKQTKELLLPLVEQCMPKYARKIRDQLGLDTQAFLKLWGLIPD